MERAEFTYTYTYRYDMTGIPPCVTSSEILQDLQNFLVEKLGYNLSGGILYKNDKKAGFKLNVTTSYSSGNRNYNTVVNVTIMENEIDINTYKVTFTTGTMTEAIAADGKTTYLKVTGTIFILYAITENGVIWRLENAMDVVTCKAKDILTGEEKFYHVMCTGDKTTGVYKEGNTTNSGIYEVLEGQKGNKRENHFKINKTDMPENMIIMSKYIYFQEMAEISGMYLGKIHPKGLESYEFNLNGKRYYKLRTYISTQEALIFELGAAT